MDARNITLKVNSKLCGQYRAFCKRKEAYLAVCELVKQKLDKTKSLERE